MKYAIARAKEGITLNGNEYLLGEDQNPITFDTSELAQKHIDDNDLEKEGAVVWEYPEEEAPKDLSVNVKEDINLKEKLR